MSADNYYVIVRNTAGKFVPVMLFASESEVSANGTIDAAIYGYRQRPEFDNIGDAYDYAMSEYAEYGVQIHSSARPYLRGNSES